VTATAYRNWCVVVVVVIDKRTSLICQRQTEDNDRFITWRMQLSLSPSSDYCTFVSIIHVHQYITIFEL